MYIKKISVAVYCMLCFQSLEVLTQEKKIEFTGAGRANIFNSTLSGKAIETDTVHSNKTNRGYTLIDLGVAIKPIKNTEIYALIRLRNEFGGFYGGGASAMLRQLRAKGTIAKFFNYQIGDIYLKQTPFTFFNHTEEGKVNEAEVFAISRQVVHYENFYLDNNWRVQGAQGQFVIKSPKIFDEIGFSGFISKNRGINWAGTRLPEKYYGGGKIDLVQSKALRVGANFVSLFSIPETAIASIPYQYSDNKVYSIDYKIQVQNDSNTYALVGESGQSKSIFYNLKPTQNNLTDYFHDIGLEGKWRKIGLILKITARQVGADFISAGAQSKRINFNQMNTIFPLMGNDNMARNIGIYDLTRDEMLYNQTIVDQLMPYNPIYASTQPYGAATPNRKGLIANISWQRKYIDLFAQGMKMQEIVGSGTALLKNFTFAKVGATLNVNTLFSLKRKIKINGGLQWENTKRSGDIVEVVNLISTLVDAGLEIEVLHKLDLMVGLKTLQAQGNEYIAVRNQWNAIEDFKKVNYEQLQSMYAIGLKYRFSDNIFLAIQGQNIKIDNKLQTNQSYGIANYHLLFNLNF